MRVTQTFLARRLGVSVGAVSKVVGRGAGDTSIRVGDRTRKRILSAARRYDYRPDRQAQMLRGVKSGLIGIIQAGGLLPFAAQRGMAVMQAVKERQYEALPCDILWHENMGTVC